MHAGWCAPLLPVPWPQAHRCGLVCTFQHVERAPKVHTSPRRVYTTAASTAVAATSPEGQAHANPRCSVAWSLTVGRVLDLFDFDLSGSPRWGSGQAWEVPGTPSEEA